MLFKRLRQLALQTSRKVSIKPHDPALNTFNFCQKELEELNTYYPQILRQTCDHDYVKQFPGFFERNKNLLNYNVNLRNIKQMSACLLPLYSYKYLEKPDKLTAENLQKAYAMCWALKMAEATLIITDDIINDSEYRYEKKSWYKKEGTHNAMLDTFVLNNVAYMVLQTELKNHPQYLNIINLWKRDTLSWIATNFKHDFSNNNGYYLITTPVRSAMYLANINNEKYHQKINDIFEHAGALVIKQNEYYDIFATFADNKKRYKSIKAGEKSWLYKKALELSNDKQKQIIEENYGHQDEESVLKIKQLYEDLQLNKVYENFSNELLENLHKQVDELPEELPRHFFHNVLHFVKNGYIN